VRVLVTGGAGYIGSQTCLELLRANHEVHVVDSLCNGKIKALERIKRLTNSELGFTECDVRNATALDTAFKEFMPEAVIHFAGLKAVSESVEKPAKYYEVNVGGTAALLGAMERAKCQNIVFSSSATVYGEPQYLPCDEQHPLNPINPYGKTKLMCEELLRDWASAKPERHAVALRYFNPVGADTSGTIGEDPHGKPNNLMPFVSQVAIGLQHHLVIFGNDYNTPDGTGVRDYIHVIDLALAHIAAIEKIQTLNQFEAINIGRGSGLSVLEIIREFQKASNCAVPYQIEKRRPGDAPAVYADTRLASVRLGFTPQRTARDMCIDTWRWQTANPNGYQENE
jgi:UDP-glucose 4-epimerase